MTTLSDIKLCPLSDKATDAIIALNTLFKNITDETVLEDYQKNFVTEEAKLDEDKTRTQNSKISRKKEFDKIITRLIAHKNHYDDLEKTSLLESVPPATDTKPLLSSESVAPPVTPKKKTRLEFLKAKTSSLKETVNNHSAALEKIMKEKKKQIKEEVITRTNQLSNTLSHAIPQHLDDADDKQLLKSIKNNHESQKKSLKENIKQLKGIMPEELIAEYLSIDFKILAETNLSEPIADETLNEIALLTKASALMVEKEGQILVSLKSQIRQRINQDPIKNERFRQSLNKANTFDAVLQINKAIIEEKKSQTNELKKQIKTKLTQISLKKTELLDIINAHQLPSSFSESIKGIPKGDFKQLTQHKNDSEIRALWDQLIDDEKILASVRAKMAPEITINKAVFSHDRHKNNLLSVLNNEENRLFIETILDRIPREELKDAFHHLALGKIKPSAKLALKYWLEKQKESAAEVMIIQMLDKITLNDALTTLELDPTELIDTLPITQSLTYLNALNQAPSLSHEKIKQGLLLITSIEKMPYLTKADKILLNARLLTPPLSTAFDEITHKLNAIEAIGQKIDEETANKTLSYKESYSETWDNDCLKAMKTHIITQDSLLAQSILSLKDHETLFNPIVLWALTGDEFSTQATSKALNLALLDERVSEDLKCIIETVYQQGIPEKYRMPRLKETQEESAKIDFGHAQIMSTVLLTHANFQQANLLKHVSELKPDALKKIAKSINAVKHVFDEERKIKPRMSVERFIKVAKAEKEIYQLCLKPSASSETALSSKEDEQRLKSIIHIAQKHLRPPLLKRLTQALSGIWQVMTDLTKFQNYNTKFNGGTFFSKEPKPATLEKKLADNLSNDADPDNATRPGDSRYTGG